MNRINSIIILFTITCTFPYSHSHTLIPRIHPQTWRKSERGDFYMYICG